MKKDPDLWLGTRVSPGEVRDLQLKVSEGYCGMTIEIPIRVVRGNQAGPAVFVTAALHGDELNGTGTIRQLIQDGIELQRGTLVLVPVLNVLAFEQKSRYLPDRRDLNRCFPGSPNGSLGSRMANVILQEIVSSCDFGIDLHTAAVRRTNFPNVRGDLRDPILQKLAVAFGSEFILDSRGPKGSLRRAACARNVPTLLFEGGEIWKVEPTIVESARRGIVNVLAHLGMHSATAPMAETQWLISTTTWLRSNFGGFLQFHISPGRIVAEGDPIATVTDLVGNELQVVRAPFDSVVIGMTTIPAVSPGEPICNLGKIPSGHARATDSEPAKLSRGSLSRQLQKDLASNVLVTDADLDPTDSPD